MKNKLKYIYAGIFFLLGSIFHQIVLHLRFKNDLLRKEMLLFMAESNSGYFLGFMVLDIFLLILLLFWMWIIKRKEQSK